MKTVLFEVRHLYYLPQFLPVIDELIARDNYLIYVSLSSNEGEAKLNIFKNIFTNKPVHVIQAKTEEKRLAQCANLKPDILFIGNIERNSLFANKQTLSVMIYHGIGLKSSYYKDTSSQIDIYAIESQGRINNMLSMGFKKEQLALCGFTKLDPLINSSVKDHHKALEAPGLDINNKTVFYTPTFYPSSVEKTVESLIKNDFRFNLILKLHQFSWQMEKYIHHIEAIKELSKKVNVYIVDKMDINIIDYYLISDLLLTDISSTMFEYLVLDRPIVQCLDFTYRKHHKLIPGLVNKRFDKARMEKVNFTNQIKDANQIIGLIDEILNSPDTMSSQRKKAIPEFLFKADGNASSRLVDFIEAKLMDTSK